MVFSKNDISKIYNLFKKINKNTEFEIMFNNYKSDNTLKLEDFIKVLKYLKFLSIEEKKKISEMIILDICFVDKNKNIFRCSIEGNENINNFLSVSHQKKKNLLFSIFISQYLENDGFSLIKKSKNKDDVIDFDNYDIRFRLSKEEDVNEETKINLRKLPISQIDNITFRYKQRFSFEIEKDFNIDLTIIRSSDKVNDIETSQKTYELEIDYSKNDSSQKNLDTIIDYIVKLKQVIVGNNVIMNKSEESDIIKKYIDLVYEKNATNNILYSMQPISTEVQHFIDFLPNKYAVSDKADGNKFCLFITNGSMYLLSNNLNVININKNIKDMDNTIFEGEYIYIESQKKFVFMMYECLFFKNKDIRNIPELTNRLDYIYRFIDNSYKLKEYSGAFNLEKVHKHYNNELVSYFNKLNKSLDNTKINDILFFNKLMVFPSGGDNSEVFLFSDLIWQNITKLKDLECPYNLDGIIYTPLKQKYTRFLKEQRLSIYKYKPPELNSIDVFIKFERNKDTGEYLRIFDNSIPDVLQYSSYQVVNIFVSKNFGDTEKPIPFNPDGKNNQIYLPIKNNNVRDIMENIVQDGTVVELVFDINSNLPKEYKWSVLKTRWDKTEYVIKHNKKYGNNNVIADKIWKSIRESITFNEIKNLSNPKTYINQMNILRSRLDSSVITSQRQQDKYYQKITNLIKKMREFHNWIKSIMIYTYASPIKNIIDGKKIRQSFLDVGCGRGGDILKVYHARVGEYVGIDIDYDGIYSATDGAISRFNFLKKKFPDFGKVSYLQADAGIELNSKDQSKSIITISSENKTKIDNIFNKNRKFDVFNFQFSIHYLFSSDVNIINLINNIKNFLKEDGHILITMFDAEKVNNKLNSNDGKFKSMYTDEDGERNILYQINKKYDELSDKEGNSIDVHMSWINEENKFIEEFLVTKKLMIDTMKNAGCVLVDTDLFENVFNLNKSYFNNVIEFEENDKNKQFYQKVANFYDKLSGADKESRELSFLYRYYIFKKIN